MSTKKSILLIAITILAFGLFFGFQAAQAGVPGTVVVDKSAFGKFNCSYDWSIDKQAPAGITVMPGQTYYIPYTIVVTRTPVECSYRVVGDVRITNNTAATIMVSEVVDELDDGTPAPIEGCKIIGTDTAVTIPYELPAGQGILCKYEALGVDGDEKENTVTFNTSVGDFSKTVGFEFNDVFGTEEYSCATVTDSLKGSLGKVCESTTFNYTVPKSYEVCGGYTVDNTASFISWRVDDTKPGKKEGSDTATVTVNVPYEGGCSLTPGYWKTHSSNGPAPYDDTWALLGENTPFFLSGKSYYQALWTAPQGNAYWILAHAYIAAKLNFLNGADPSAAQAAFDQATALLVTYTPAQIGALRGSTAPRPTFISLAATLDNYNNGLIGPGHCSE